MLITEILHLNNSEETTYLSFNIFVIYFDFSGRHGKCWRQGLILFLILPPGGPRHIETINANFFQLNDHSLGILNSIHYFSSKMEDKYFLIQNL